MKTKINTNGRGMVYFKSPNAASPYDTSYTTEPFMFDYHTLKDWYPLDINYTYVYSKKRGTIETVREVGLTDTNRYKATEIIEGDTLDYISWECPSVKKDNLQVTTMAKELGLKTIADNYDTSDVYRGLKRVGDLIDSYTADIALTYVRKCREENPNYPNYESTKMETLALNHLTKNQELYYLKLGQLYNMYSIMKKVVDKVGFA